MSSMLTMSSENKYINLLTNFRCSEVAEIAKFSPKEKERYEERLKYYRDLKNIVDASKEEGRMEGKMEGKIEGRMEGKIEGRIEGRMEGRMEGREEEKIEIASNLKKQGIPIAVIIQATGLSEDVIENLN
ncbi:Rpn family recombination-promoting nuclease/putative transposase [Aureispira anguillae]|uniref:Rpn family recombination-promoting nuclease/putative transposase n=1 Tax=Aureispira anguillae TaxID=2864201 RepID=A0A915YF94_9BACT|nr:Rpn family recombination-promoting nuclease/putative transposase [Aureispira anguillae]BDS12047.1 Rpn family recombination-promoting nuclease/putative transposase [Aureispira anguillae]